MPRSAHPARSAGKSAKPAAKRSRASPATSSTRRYTSKVPRRAPRVQAPQELQDDEDEEGRPPVAAGRVSPRGRLRRAATALAAGARPSRSKS